MTYEQKLNMEHYKALGIKLHKVDKRSHLFTNYSESVKSLIILKGFRCARNHFFIKSFMETCPRKGVNLRLPKPVVHHDSYKM